MNRRSLHILLVLFLCQTYAFAQLDAIQELSEVILTDTKMIHFSEGYKVEKIADSIIDRNSTSLTETLRYNSGIYFKENGNGMVSSPSFRGTNAAQTAVIWNGININSVFTGQTDFNTLSPTNYNNISIRSGGGGVQYGSGAVGGSVHLNNDFSFKKKNHTKLGLHYGSFTTLGGNVRTIQSTENSYIGIGTNFIDSENDYEYIGKNKDNVHGQFSRFSANVDAAHKWGKGSISLNSGYSYNRRNFSGSLNTIGKDGYKDINTRNLFQLKQKMGVFNSTASVAHLFEEYKYFPDSEKFYFEGGKANTFIAIVQSEFFAFRNVRVLGKLQYDVIKAEGKNIGDPARKTLAAVVLINHKISEKFNYGINFRKEFLNNFDNPFLFSADAKWQITNAYSVKLNGSKNYRVPTFNDLFWYSGGNMDLKPETSYQLDFGQEIQIGKFKAEVSTYFISSTDLIKWIPGTGQLWYPVNISETKNYGAEANLDYNLFLGKFSTLNVSANYSYTHAEDIQKGKQLIYVPFHKAWGKLEFTMKKLSVYIQGLYTGEVFTTTDNSEVVSGYTLFNLGADYTLYSLPKISFGGRIKNVFDQYYENVAFRPMPSRYFEIFINFNI